MALADQIIGGEEMGSGSFSKEELLELLKEVVKNHKRQENYYFLLPLAIRAGYHFSNHAVKSPINIGIRLFTRISTFPNPAFLNRKVQIAVSTYSVPHAAARI